MTVVSNNCLSIMKHDKYSNEFIVTTELMLNNERIIIVNVYFLGKADADRFIDRLQTIVHDFDGINILMVGDLNTHSPVWGGECFDSRGGLLEEFFASNNLYVVNNPYSPPTFTSSRGESWIDVTTCNEDLFPYIINWRVMEEDSISEHAYIAYEIVGAGNNNISVFNNRRRFDVSKANWEEIQHFLQEHLNENYSQDSIEVRSQIGQDIKTINTACKNYIPIKKHKNRSVP
ncbi:uncharacterized protein LOC111615322 [Centruroides sculpturatus]|uniref:uncharacterized protein LOC111615322 n=1 Tax=Centruroides sculpturatus TaxID=218467 RepID=UPI000C6DD43E|nr:uncharacterized protein LOC111615322 [Centruroides sculpturatus]